MSDISKEDLKKEIQEILKDADLDNTSAKKVRTFRLHILHTLLSLGYQKKNASCIFFLKIRIILYVTFLVCAAYIRQILK